MQTILIRISLANTLYTCSVSNKFINTHLDIQEDNNKLYVYYNKEMITMHEISEKNINYKKSIILKVCQKYKKIKSKQK